MTDTTRPGGDAGAGDNPWAPPQTGSVGQGVPGQAPAYEQPPAQPQAWPPPASTVHDQATMAAMPSGFPPPTAGAPVDAPPAGSAVPPPPIAPTGPGAPAGYGYPGGQPGYPVYPGYPAYGWPGGPMVPQNGMGVAAMVLGILACCLFCMYGVLSLVLGVLAVVFGVKGRRRAARGEADNHGQAQAGFIMGIIGIVLGLAVIAFLVVVAVYAANDDSDDDPYYDNALRSAPTAPLVP